MADVIGTDTLAALSATLAYWFAIGGWCMAFFCWRNRYRYTHWLSISARERADAALNFGLLLVFVNAFYQGSLAAYSFAAREWTITPTTMVMAPLYLPATMLAMSLFLWWAAFEMFGADRRWWWCLWMWSGMALFAVIEAVF